MRAFSRRSKALFFGFLLLLWTSEWALPTSPDVWWSWPGPGGDYAFAEFYRNVGPSPHWVTVIQLGRLHLDIPMRAHFVAAMIVAFLLGFIYLAFLGIRVLLERLTPRA